MKILVVDDEDAVRELVKDAMVEQGYQVWAAANGRAALELGGEFEFDLVFCDVVMDGLTGFEVLKAVRQWLSYWTNTFYCTDQECFYFRVFGYGLWFGSYRVYRPLFSERNGYRWAIRCWPGWRMMFLRPS